MLLRPSFQSASPFITKLWSETNINFLVDILIHIPQWCRKVATADKYTPRKINKGGAIVLEDEESFQVLMVGKAMSGKKWVS